MELLNMDDAEYVEADAGYNDSFERNIDDPGDDVPMLGRHDNESKKEENHRIWHLAYFQPWFDLTTEIALTRLRSALSPWRNEAFYSVNTDDRPDLYCPLWILATLTFLVAAVSNVARYLDSQDAGKHIEDWSSDVVQLTVASSILGCFSLFVPITIYGILRHIGKPKDFVEILSIYGYSLTVYIPSTFLLAFPSPALRWMIFLVAAAVSIAFLVRNLWLTSQTGWSSPRSGNGIPCLAVIITAHAVLALVIKFYYFSFKG